MLSIIGVDAERRARQVMDHRHFPTHTTDTAPHSARAVLEGTTRKFGFVPSPVARQATSPETLQGFLKAVALFDASTLSPMEREVVTFVVATGNGCDYCVAMHSATLAGTGADGELLNALRDQRVLPVVRLERLREFTLAVIAAAGAVADEELERFLAAGFTPRNALEVVLGIGAYTISTYANRMTAAPLDPPFEPFAWEPRAAAGTMAR